MKKAATKRQGHRPPRLRSGQALTVARRPRKRKRNRLLDLASRGGMGGVVMIYPQTARGKKWIKENVETEPWQWMGQGLAVEARYAHEIIDSAGQDGLHVKGANPKRRRSMVDGRRPIRAKMPKRKKNGLFSGLYSTILGEARKKHPAHGSMRSPVGAKGSGRSHRSRSRSSSSGASADVVSALRNLGYRGADAKAAAARATGSDFDSQFRSALGSLRKNPVSHRGHRGKKREGRKNPRRKSSVSSVAKRRQRRLNPVTPATPEQAGTARMFGKFHGRAPDKLTRIKIPNRLEHDMAKLGNLCKIVIGEEITTNGSGAVVSGAEAELTFPAGRRPILASNAEGTQLYIIGGDQDLEGSLSKLGSDPTKDFADLGALGLIEYDTEKHFDDFRPTIYWHRTGEDGGELPRVMYDKRNRRLVIVGGEYRVKPEGIVN